MSQYLEDFIAGSYERQFQYTSFLPNNINLQWKISDPETLSLMEEANRLLGELNAFSQLTPGADFVVAMHMAKEAAASSRLEGARTSMEEALMAERDIKPEKRDDWRETRNCVKAINFAIEELERLPLSNRLFKETHRVLMREARGQYPGEFRVSQNWIGLSLKKAVFVPPHHERVMDLMSDLETFIHNEEIHVPHLIKIAIIHYQLETIHPFLDGNGRLGRLMIVLYLVAFKLLAKPALYMSDFFERHKTYYYSNLMAVRTHNAMIAWVRFFLLGLRETAEKSVGVFKSVLKLKENIERERLPTFHARRQNNAQKFIAGLYQQPIVSVREVSKLLGTSANTANKLVADFEKLGILRELTGHRRNRLFIFDEYTKIFGD